MKYPINETQELKTIQDVQKIEEVSPFVSEKYVPIFTSDVIKVLEPEFKFVRGYKWYKTTSQHYVELKHGEDTIRIYNSFDRSTAFRMFLQGDVAIDLGVDRLVHMGSKAVNFKDELIASKQDIVDAIKKAKEGMAQLGKVQVTPELQKEISDVVFAEDIKKKGFQSYSNSTDILVEKKGMSVLSYIKSSVANYIKGTYTVTNSGTKKEGTEKRAAFTKITLEGKVNKYLVEKFPELFL